MENATALKPSRTAPRNAQDARPRYYEAPEVGTVATVHYQRGWCIRLQISPDEVELHDALSFEQAERIALRHAAQFA